MKWILLSVVLFASKPVQDSQQQDPKPIHRLILESIATESSERSLLLDRRIMELNEENYAAVFRKVHKQSHVQAVIHENLIDDVCEPSPRDSLPVESWQCRGSAKATAISFGDIQYQGEDSAECIVRWNYDMPRTRSTASDSIEYLHVLTIVKFQFRLDKNRWVVRDRVGILDAHGPAPPPGPTSH